jgi:hypothetical protein
MLYMHKEGVPVEIITTLMRHGKEIRRANAVIQAAEARRRAQLQDEEPLAVLTTSAPAYYAPQPPVVYTPQLSPSYVAPCPPYSASPYYPYRGYYDHGYAPAIGLGFGFSFRGGFGHAGGHGGHR